MLIERMKDIADGKLTILSLKLEMNIKIQYKANLIKSWLN